MKKDSALRDRGNDLRRRAENQLHMRPARRKQTQAGADPDTQRTIQELQIHQIELELQNEELRRAKAEVDSGLEKYTDLYDSAPVGYFSLDEHGLIQEANLTGAAMLGTPRASLTNRRFHLFVAPDGRPAFHTFLARIQDGRAKQACELSLLSHGRAPFWAGLEAKPTSRGPDARKWCRVAVIDIAARKQAEDAQHRLEILAATNRTLEEEVVRRRAAEAALQASERRAHLLLEQSRHLSHQILLVQENERREISRKLHDEISQLLMGINVHLTIFTKAAALNPKGIGRTIAPIRQLVEKSVQLVHQFARDLRPAMLDELGLIPALRSYLEDLPKRKGQQIQFTAFAGVETLDNDKRTALYRIAQEAVTNATKHAQACTVKVCIRKVRGAACLEITDNGIGFDVGRLLSAQWGNRLGLVGMRERVEMIGGRFSVVSAPGTGTTIRAEVPLGKNLLRA